MSIVVLSDEFLLECIILSKCIPEFDRIIG